MDLREKVSAIIAKHTDLPKDKIKELLTIPPQRNLGHFAFPCFMISQKTKTTPQLAAAELKAKIESSKDELVRELKTVGPYLNFFINTSIIAEDIIIKSQNSEEWKGNEDKNILIEFASPNTNKPLHLGHLRNISLGDALSRIFKKAGSKVTTVNLWNDRGIAVCKAMIAYQKWHNGQEPPIKSDHFVGQLYVEYEKKQTEDIQKETEEMLRKWEANDPDTRELWQKIRTWTVNGVIETFKKLSISFDFEESESDLYDKGKDIVMQGLKKKIFHKTDNGAIEVDLEKEGLGKKILIRGDGTAIYITQDIFVAINRHNKVKFDQGTYVVASEQEHHFKVLFAILKKLGHEWADKLYHLSYGMVCLPEGRMKSREGTVVDADNLLDDVTTLAAEEVLSRYKDLTQKEINTRSHAIALAALRFQLLNTNPKKDITFDPKKSISFEGDTGPYCLYVYARCTAILNKAGKPEAKPDFKLLIHPAEADLILLLHGYQDTIISSADNQNPSLITQYCLDIGHAFNTFYNQCPVHDAESDQLKASRRELVDAIRKTLKDALSILNIQVLEQM